MNRFSERFSVGDLVQISAFPGAPAVDQRVIGKIGTVLRITEELGTALIRFKDPVMGLWEWHEHLECLALIEAASDLVQASDRRGRRLPGPRETATILAALRLYQRHLEGDGLPHSIGDIATDGGNHPALSAAEIEMLCEKMNYDSMDSEAAA